MYSEVLFHGSNRSRGEKILREQEMPITRGTKHWLGDGSYFFVEDFYAYKWIIDMFKKRYKEEELTNITVASRYIMLKTVLEMDRIKVFDLTKAEHKIFFDGVHKLLKKRKGQTTRDFAEGVVLNYLFDTLNYSERYDVVKAIFLLNSSSYSKVKTRLNYMPQEQICIKNPEIVKNISESNFSSRIDFYEDLLSNFRYV